MSNWTPQDSETLYNVPNWAKGFFSIGPQGTVQVHPSRSERTIDLGGLLEQIKRRGVQAPILLRFDGILRTRVREIKAAFDTAREEFSYGAEYRGVYPIKVNQQREVVETILSEREHTGIGLEVGSKPELLAAIALQAGEGSFMVCNGYKDRDYVEMALLSQHIGITTIIVIEKFTELATVVSASQRLGIRPHIGVRSKLSVRGSGRWEQSAGDRSKFGLTAAEIVRVVSELKRVDMLDCLELLHFHIGSQVTHIRSIKHAMREAANTLVSLTRMGANIRWFDAGGGLGVDYDGSNSNFESSRNYSLQEYANDVVSRLAETCRTEEIPEPTIVTESGRALVAHHAVLVGEVVGVTTVDDDAELVPVLDEPRTTAPEIFDGFEALLEKVTEENYLESYHDALELREEAMLLYSTGQLSLEDRAKADALFWRVNKNVLAVTRTLDYVPDDLANLERDLADTYFINFSVFQSMPDAWAIGQMFPILPLQRHTEEPRRRAILADMTCDSDGKIDSFIDLQSTKSTLEVHDWRPNDSYSIGFFLVGAYQEILGDMHNLFGDTNIVHVDLDEQDKLRLTHVLRGDRVKEVLSYVEYFEEDLLRNLRRHVENSLEQGEMSFEESALFWRRYETALNGYTYLARGDAAEDQPQAQLTRLEDRTELHR